jgi:hypothetical protein
MKKLTSFIASILFYNSLFCAGPFLHVYLANAWMTACQKYDSYEAKLFILGTLFPDIRYMAHIPRETTHIPTITLDELIFMKDPFLAGLYFHSFVDEFRARFVQEKGIETLLKHIPTEHKATFLKLIEDDIVYSLMSWDGAWDSALDALETFPISEQEHAQLRAIPYSTIKQWHTTLYNLFTAKPSTFIAHCTHENKEYSTLSPDIIKTWNSIFKQYAENKIIHQYVYDLLEAFSKAFQPVCDIERDSTYPNPVLVAPRYFTQIPTCSLLPVKPFGSAALFDRLYEIRKIERRKHN